MTNMLSDDAQVFRRLQHGRKLLGDGWKWVESFDDINEDAYEDEEEEVSWSQRRILQDISARGIWLTSRNTS